MQKKDKQFEQRKDISHVEAALENKRKSDINNVDLLWRQEQFLKEEKKEGGYPLEKIILCFKCHYDIL